MVGFLLALLALWVWMYRPLTSSLMPALATMKERSGQFAGPARRGGGFLGLTEVDSDGDGRISLAELQSGAQVALLVHSEAAFERSLRDWQSKINSMQSSFRQEFSTLMDGDPSPQPKLVALLLVFCLIMTYATLLCDIFTSMWRGVPSMERWLKFESWLKPGCRVRACGGTTRDAGGGGQHGVYARALQGWRQRASTVLA